MIAHYASRKKSNEKGLLFASGLITGEALMGIFVALPIFITGNKYWWPTMPGNQLLGVLLFILIGFTFYKTAQEK